MVTRTRSRDETITIAPGPGAGHPSAPTVWAMRIVQRSLAVAVVAVLALAGCTAGVGNEAASDGDTAVEPAAPGAPGAPEDEAGEDSGGGEAVVTTGDVSLVVEDPAATAAEVAALVEGVGGHVQERVQQTGGDEEGGTAYLVVRIPADEVSGALERLEELGEVDSTSIQSQIVTDQVRDLDARIRALEISISRLEDLLGRSGTVSEIVEAERILTERQSELEVLLGQKAVLDDRIAFSTFRVELWTEESEPVAERRTGFLPGLQAGWDALVATVTGVLHALGALLPWILLGGLVWVLVQWLRRRARARRPVAAPVAAPAAVPVGAPAPAPVPAPVPGSAPVGVPVGGGAPAPQPSGPSPSGAAPAAPPAPPSPPAQAPAPEAPAPGGSTAVPPAERPKRAPRRRTPPPAE